jgi:threonine synthase
LAEGFSSDRASEEETLSRITATLAESAELLCPHSAVGVEVAMRQPPSATPMVTLATAHPAKFPDAVENASGIRPPLPKRMADLYDRSERVTEVASDLGAIEALIQEKRRA